MEPGKDSGRPREELSCEDSSAWTGHLGFPESPGCVEKARWQQGMWLSQHPRDPALPPAGQCLGGQGQDGKLRDPQLSYPMLGPQGLCRARPMKHQVHTGSHTPGGPGEQRHHRWRQALLCGFLRWAAWEGELGCLWRRLGLKVRSRRRPFRGQNQAFQHQAPAASDEGFAILPRLEGEPGMLRSPNGSFCSSYHGSRDRELTIWCHEDAPTLLLTSTKHFLGLEFLINKIPITKCTNLNLTLVLPS